MKTCTVEGCDRKHVAKGMCSGHYNRANYTPAQLHPKRLTPCAVCGTSVLKYATDRRSVCSLECRYVLRFGRPRPRGELVGPLPRPPRVTQPAATPHTVGSRPGFIAGPCRWCGETFVQDVTVGGGTARYCTRPCARAAEKRARKAREHGAKGTYTLAEVIRVWLRLGKRCAYCEQPVEGLPDPDHVTPLSRGGSNSITNILPACRLCNADKNDMTLAEWAHDRLRRGKPERVTTWAADDQRVRHLVLSQATRPSPIKRTTLAVSHG